MQNDRQIKYFSMFTGVGGFELGINSNNNQCSTEKFQNRQGGNRDIKEQGEMLCTSDKPSFSCVGFSEIDKYANQLLANKFPEVRNYGDATKINASELPDFDMLCGGFPCQSFSIAGKRRGFEDTRGTMFFHIARILEVKRPKIVWLENVKGLLNHDKGETFKVIIQTLSELGYDVQWMVLNSKFHGVPQNRERVFIIGSLRGEPRPEVLPFREINNEINKSNGEKIMLDVYNKNVRTECPALSQPEHNNIRVAFTIDANYWKGTSEKHFKDKKTRQLVYTPKVRRLTPTECERLQGFPDNWTSGFSDTQRYKMMGNAVTVNVIKAIANKLFVKDGRSEK